MLALGGGISLGQGTFRSITQDKVNVGAQVGVLGGYQLSPLLGLEASLTTAAQTQTALICDPFWLSKAGVKSYAPVLDQEGSYYADILARTRWTRLGLQANFNLLSLLLSGSPWSVNLSPQVSALTTRTMHHTPDYDQSFGRQWHLGYGGQVSVGYKATQNLGVQLYAGITALTGERFDNIPFYYHTSNLFWEGGLKLTWHFSRKRQKPAPVVEIVPTPKPEPPVPEEISAQASHEVEETVIPIEEVTVPEEEVVTPISEPESPALSFPEIFFADNTTALEDSEVRKLRQVLKILLEYPDVRVSIHGYASKTGEPEYNRQISERRCKVVQKWLVKRGIDPARLEPLQGHGVDTQAPNNRKARRVSFILQ